MQTNVVVESRILVVKDRKECWKQSLGGEERYQKDKRELLQHK